MFNDDWNHYILFLATFETNIEKEKRKEEREKNEWLKR